MLALWPQYPTSTLQQQKAIGESRLHPVTPHSGECTRPLRALWRQTMHNASTALATVECICRHKGWQVVRRVQTSTKPETYCRQSRTEPRPQVTCTENLDMCLLKDKSTKTDNHTDRHKDHNTLHSSQQCHPCSPTKDNCTPSQEVRIKQHQQNKTERSDDFVIPKLLENLNRKGIKPKISQNNQDEEPFRRFSWFHARFFRWLLDSLN